MTAGTRGSLVLLLLITLPVAAEAQRSLLTLPSPHWGATREEITATYGSPLSTADRFLLYRPVLDYGPNEIRLEFDGNRLVRIIIGMEPAPELDDQVIRDVSALLRARPRMREVREGILYVWDNGYSFAEYGPLPAADPRDWNTLQFTDRRRIRN